MRVGDLLRTPSGVDATIIGVRYHVARVEVYTLTLGANHDFFVGTARVLVHNCGPVYEASRAAQKLSEHADEFRGVSVSEYRRRAQDLFNIDVSKDPNILEEVTPDGTVFRVNTQTGEFGISDYNGEIDNYYLVGRGQAAKEYLDRVILDRERRGY